MTMKRKKDKSQPKDDKDYDYESLKVFLTAESAMPTTRIRSQSTNINCLCLRSL